jgi:hypothetical protein
MLRTGDWSEVTPKHFAALYVLMHVRVYGVRPDDSVKQYKRMAMLAGGMLGYEDDPKRTGVFAGDAGAMVRFTLWLWKREKERDEWRQTNGRPRTRLAMHHAFARALVDDWRVSVVART